MFESGQSCLRLLCWHISALFALWHSLPLYPYLTSSGDDVEFCISPPITSRSTAHDSTFSFTCAVRSLLRRSFTTLARPSGWRCFGNTRFRGHDSVRAPQRGCAPLAGSLPRQTHQSNHGFSPDSHVLQYGEINSAPRTRCAPGSLRQQLRKHSPSQRQRQAVFQTSLPTQFSTSL